MEGLKFKNNMNVIALPNKYYELALHRHGTCAFFNEFHKFQFLDKAFRWSNTPEGSEFWGSVDRGLKPKIPEITYELFIDQAVILPYDATDFYFPESNQPMKARIYSLSGEGVKASYAAILLEGDRQSKHIYRPHFKFISILK